MPCHDTGLGGGLDQQARVAFTMTPRNSHLIGRRVFLALPPLPCVVEVRRRRRVRVRQTVADSGRRASPTLGTPRNVRRVHENKRLERGLEREIGVALLPIIAPETRPKVFPKSVFSRRPVIPSSSSSSFPPSCQPLPSSSPFKILEGRALVTRLQERIQERLGLQGSSPR